MVVMTLQQEMFFILNDLIIAHFTQTFCKVILQCLLINHQFMVLVLNFINAFLINVLNIKGIPLIHNSI